MKRKSLLLVLLLLTMHLSAASGFRLIEAGKGASVCYNGNEQVVKTAIELFLADSKLVCNAPGTLVQKPANQTVLVGIPGRDSEFDGILTQNKINLTEVNGKWEAFKLEAVEAPNGDSYLLVIGSDARGAAYGVLELSRKMGVSPWVWWADVTPQKQSDVQLEADNTVHCPSVQYRGIFLNDEDWAIMPWSSKTFEPTPRKGEIGPKTYGKVCELLLRLRANSIWPAMHECTIPFFATPGNKEIADKYGIVVGTSHCEPMLRTNTGEWDYKKSGSYNFLTNKANVLSYWEERVKEASKTENIYTLGMRGIHDGRMQGVKSLDEETAALQEAIAEQRNLLTAHHPEGLSEIPQIFVPYKEVLKAYENGLNLPSDVTLMWCDDNHGHITRLSNNTEQQRSGGAGVYYHISYWGNPHDYLWLASTQPALIYTEMKRAWDYGARCIWILNVGDIKPGEYLTEFFLDMAWDINSIDGNSIFAHQEKWLEANLKGTPTRQLTEMQKTYYHLGGQRKPEHMGWTRVEVPSIPGGLTSIRDTEFSPFYFNDEIDQRIAAYAKIANLSDTIYRNLSDSQKPAYFQLIHYPVKASYAMNRKLLYAQKARLYARYHLPVAEEYARESTAAYNEIAALDYTYNKDMLHGKWDGMMDMKPRDLPVFQAAPLPDGTQTEGGGEPLVWMENDTVPVSSKNLVLPVFTQGADEGYLITVHPRNRATVQWNVKDIPGYVTVREVDTDRLAFEKKLIVSVKDASVTDGTFILNINGTSYTVSYQVKKREVIMDNRYVEHNKMIALRAADYTNKISSETLEGLGYSGMSVGLPIAKKISPRMPHLEYQVFTTSSGTAQLKIGTLPLHPANGGEIRLAVMIDNQKPQIVSLKIPFLSSKWADSVLRNQTLTVLNVYMGNSGHHTLRVFALDEELVLDQLMLDFSPERSHYLIPTNK